MKILKNFLACAAAPILVAAGLTFSVFKEQNPKLSDPEIVSVAVVANKIDMGTPKSQRKNRRIRTYCNLQKPWSAIIKL